MAESERCGARTRRSAAGRCARGTQGRERRGGAIAAGPSGAFLPASPVSPCGSAVRLPRRRQSLGGLPAACWAVRRPARQPAGRARCPANPRKRGSRRRCAHPSRRPPLRVQHRFRTAKFEQRARTPWAVRSGEPTCLLCCMRRAPLMLRELQPASPCPRVRLGAGLHLASTPRRRLGRSWIGDGRALRCRSCRLGSGVAAGADGSASAPIAADARSSRMLLCSGRLVRPRWAKAAGSTGLGGAHGCYGRSRGRTAAAERGRA